MGNGFRRFGLVSAGLLFFAACGGDSGEEDDTNNGPRPYSGNNSGVLPAQPAPNPSADPNAMVPADPANPAPSNNTEAPPINAPVVPPPPMTDGNTNGTPQTPTPTPPVVTPPVQTPPGMMTPPVVTPPVTPTPPTPPPAGPQTRVFLLFGQSNMWGVPLPQQQDLTTNARVEVLTTQQCARHGNNQWVPAQPPLHGCVGAPGTSGQGPGVGPGDYFGKAMADAFPQDTILLVPAAVPGVSISTFQPGQQNYTNLLNRARMAQTRGTISGMIFHQGESDNNNPNWPTNVKTTVDRLRSDLGIGEVPFVVGELFRGAFQGHNMLVNRLPTIITNAAVASSEGFGALPQAVDTFGNLHIDLAGQREFGRRFAAEMIELLGE